VGLAAHTGQVDVRITAKADTEAEADSMIAVVEEELRQKVGKFIFGTDQQTIESVLVKLLTEKGVSIAISETGISHPVLTAVEAAENGSRVIASKQGYNSISEARSAVSVTETTPIRELAEQIAKNLSGNSDKSAAIAAISSPDDQDHADNEGGTAIAVNFDGKIRSRVFGFGGQNDIAANWVSSWSLSMLWQMVKEKYES
jgi:nicotinamide-nucleotide amidase